MTALFIILPVAAFIVALFLTGLFKLKSKKAWVASYPHITTAARIAQQILDDEDDDLNIMFAGDDVNPGMFKGNGEDRLIIMDSVNYEGVMRISLELRDNGDEPKFTTTLMVRRVGGVWSEAGTIEDVSTSMIYENLGALESWVLELWPDIGGSLHQYVSFRDTLITGFALANAIRYSRD